MVSFELQLDPVTYQEILLGGTYVAFDIVAAQTVEIYFTETDANPGNVNGNLIYSHPPSWDYEGVGFEALSQYVWVRGKTTIRGVRQT